MRLAVLLLGACGFSAQLEPAASDACVSGTWWNTQYAHRFPVDTTGAPAGYTARIDATAVLALSSASGEDLRVVVDHATELARAIDGTAVEARVPATGSLWLYVGNAMSSAAPADPDAIYAWSESFSTLAVNSDGAPRFAPQTPADWRVVDDNGNRIYRVGGSGRHPAPIAGLSATDVEIRARIRIGPTPGQNHNGLMVRASNPVPPMLDGFVGQLLEDSEYSRIAEYIDGISPPTERGTHSRPVDRNAWYAMRMRAIGTTLELYVDGALEVSTTMGTNNGMLAGLFAHDPDVDYDDVRVRRITSPEPAFALGAREDAPCR